VFWFVVSFVFVINRIYTIVLIRVGVEEGRR
jgi:hypothetical protein